MIRAVVIDDIERIRKENIAIIKSNCPNISIIGQADSVESGVKLIKLTSPDLVFLDVEMSDGTGFDLLQKLKPIQFKVIFITGYEDFAIRAFRFSAIDYLLKPLDATELVDAVKKRRNRSIKRFSIQSSTTCFPISNAQRISKN